MLKCVMYRKIFQPFHHFIITGYLLKIFAVPAKSPERPEYHNHSQSRPNQQLPELPNIAELADVPDLASRPFVQKTERTRPEVQKKTKPERQSGQERKNEIERPVYPPKSFEPLDQRSKLTVRVEKKPRQQVHHVLDEPPGPLDSLQRPDLHAHPDRPESHERLPILPHRPEPPLVLSGDSLCIHIVHMYVIYTVFIKYCVFLKILKYIPDSGLTRFPLGVSVCT